MERSQMTFYASFWDAINGLPKKDQLPLFRAVVSYGLYGKNKEDLTASQKAFFALMQPVLDASRKKAASGKEGGSKTKANDKQTESKTEANDKQTASEKEKERENERENEIEIEGEKDKEQMESAPQVDEALFSNFWNFYPAGKGGDRDEAWRVWKELSPSVDTAKEILDGLLTWADSGQWKEDGGRYVPGAAKFLRERRWISPPTVKFDSYYGEGFPETLAYARKFVG